MIRYQLLSVGMVLFGVYLESRYKIIEKSIDKLKRRMK